MKHEDLQRHLTRYRKHAEEARRTLDHELRDHFPPIVSREIERLRKVEIDAMKLLIVAELAAGMMDDADALAAWMLECVEAGEIVERSAAEEAW